MSSINIGNENQAKSIKLNHLRMNQNYHHHDPHPNNLNIKRSALNDLTGFLNNNPNTTRSANISEIARVSSIGTNGSVSTLNSDLMSFRHDGMTSTSDVTNVIDDDEDDEDDDELSSKLQLPPLHSMRYTTSEMASLSQYEDNSTNDYTSTINDHNNENNYNNKRGYYFNESEEDETDEEIIEDLDEEDVETERFSLKYSEYQRQLQQQHEHDEYLEEESELLESDDEEDDDDDDEEFEEEFEEDDDDDEVDDDEVDDDEVDENIPPKPMKIKSSKRIDKELTKVYKMFHQKYLDPEDQDSYETSMVAEYSPEIFNYIHSLELRLRPDANYMERQHEIKWYMRSTLIDWLVQLHSKFKLFPETLFLTINYIDRFLSKKKVSLSRLQLVGAVALFIAAKYEEISCPSLKDMIHVCDYVYTEDDFIRAEKFMIDVLEFDMGWPGPMSFLRRTSKADDYDYETRTLAKYLLETTIMDYKFVNALPSWLAAGSHFLARLLLNRGEWTPAHIYYSGYTSEQLMPLANYILDTCRRASNHHGSIFEKYQQSCFKRVSTYVQNWIQVVGDEE